MTTEKDLTAMRSLLKEHGAAVKAEGLAQAALDHSVRTGERVAVVENEQRTVSGKLDLVLERLGARPFDVWLQRAALAGVTCATVGVVLWLFKQHVAGGP